MEEEFYASIKLMSGEEIVGKVCYDADEDVVIIENPKKVNPVQMKKGNTTVSGFTFENWVAATYDDMFIVKRDHILTMTELDSRIQKFYELSLTENPNEYNSKVDPSTQAGYISSIDDARKTLEVLYNKS